MPQEEAIELRYSLSQKLSWLILARLLIVFGLTVLYTLAHRFSRALLFQARFQFVVDIFLVTWLVWITDVIHSPYIALYIVIIAASSLFLGPRDAIVTSVACSLAFTVSALAALTGFSQHPTHDLLDTGRSQTFQ